MKAVIHGLGYVGRPLFELCVRRGIAVIGVDPNEHARSLCQEYLNQRSEDRAEGVNFHGNKLVSPEEGKVHGTLHVICVPTPIDQEKRPDFTAVFQSAKLIGASLRKHDTVILESTVFPGFTELHLLPVLEKYAHHLKPSQINIAHCPERINPGDQLWNLENIPRVLGANTRFAELAASKFYQRLTGGPIFSAGVPVQKGALSEKIDDGNIIKNLGKSGSISVVSGIKSAEAIKVMENTARDVNIALANEFSKIARALDINLSEVIRGMETKPFGRGPYYPGIGVGGHCIAVDPEWLISASTSSGYDPIILRSTRALNRSMPDYWINELCKTIREDGRDTGEISVGIAGIAYKAETSDTRESPYFAVSSLCEQIFKRVECYDPYVLGLSTKQTLEALVESVDSIILVTDHKLLAEQINSGKLNLRKIKYIIDGRGCVSKRMIEEMGVKLISVS